jgi:hypothetical protein
VHMIAMLENDARLPPLCARRNHALAALAEQALIAEAELTPKPGLVDRRGSGAHSDLSLQLMRLSATSLRPFFAAMGAISTGRDLDISLRRDSPIGRSPLSSRMATWCESATASSPEPAQRPRVGFRTCSNQGS